MNSANKPLVSVILSAHNEEKYLKTTIDSISRQTFSNFEFIIINDGSNDKTKTILEEYLQNDMRIIIINNAYSLGLTTSLNKGLEVARGEYIARIDAGDIAYPDRLQKQVEYMNLHKNIYVLGSWVNLSNSRYELIGEWTTPFEINDKLLFKNNGIIHPSVLIRRKLFDKVGKYDQYYSRAQDYELWFRAAINKIEMRNLQEALTIYMERSGGISDLHINAMMRYTFKIKLKYLRHCLNFWSLLYTLRTLLGILILLLPARKLIVYYSKLINAKIYRNKQVYFRHANRGTSELSSGKYNKNKSYV